MREFGLSDDRVAKNVSLSVTEKNNGNTVFFHVALSGDPLGLGRDMMEYLSPNDIEVVVKCGAEESLERTVVCYDYDEDDEEKPKCIKERKNYQKKKNGHTHDGGMQMSM